MEATQSDWRKLNKWSDRKTFRHYSCGLNEALIWPFKKNEKRKTLIPPNDNYILDNREKRLYRLPAIQNKTRLYVAIGICRYFNRMVDNILNYSCPLE